LTIDRSLDSLDPRFYLKAIEFLARLTEAKIYVMVIETGRTWKRQEHLLEMGASQTKRSKHLSGEAIDLAPILQYKNGRVLQLEWSADAQLYKRMGEIASQIGGIRWGGDFKSFKDLVHFELE